MLGQFYRDIIMISSPNPNPFSGDANGVSQPVIHPSQPASHGLGGCPGAEERGTVAKFCGGSLLKC